MMVFWEHSEMNVKELGERLFLDSGTLTPVLKKLEAKEYISRTRSKDDERNLIVRITEKGEALKEQACSIPERMASCFSLEKEEAVALKNILNKLMKQFGQGE